LKEQDNLLFSSKSRDAIRMTDEVVPAGQRANPLQYLGHNGTFTVSATRAERVIKRAAGNSPYIGCHWMLLIGLEFVTAQLHYSENKPIF
jgi:hypothetical protein